MSAVDLHFELDGASDAPPVVLSSSLGTTAAMWAPQRAALAADHRVISYDHRGHGDSPVPLGPYAIDDLGGDVLALLDRLEIERASWCGISIGGMVGLWLAANAPERIERLVVICSSAYAPPPSRWADRAAAVLAAGSTQTIADAVVERWFTADYAQRSPEGFAAAKAMLLSAPAEGYAGCCAVIERLDLREELARISAPTLVISAAGDEALPPEHGRAIADAIPQARFVLVEHGAHLVTIEQPAELNRLIATHLAATADAETEAVAVSLPAETGDDPVYDSGMEVRRAVLGDEHVDSAIARTTEFTAPFQDFITRYAWGTVWARDELDRRTRSVVTLAVLCALGREHEIAMHVRAALRNGLEPAEIAEVFLQTAVYAGVPAANRAFAIADQTLREAGVVEPPAEAS
jgi:3-oxoadipate enol-lactonase/4-carboxymuconolactone decarboxylase